MTGMRGRGRGGIASTFVRSLVLTATVSVGIVWICLAILFRRVQIGSIEDIQTRNAQQVALLVADYLDSARRSLRIFEGTSSLGRLDSGGRRLALDRFLMYGQPMFSQVSLFDPTGMELARASRFHSYLPSELADRSSDLSFIEAASGRESLSDVYLSSEGGLLSVVLAIPLAEHGLGQAAVLGAEVNVSILWAEVAGIRIGRSGYAYLVDARGRFIAYQELSTILHRHGEDMTRMPPVADFRGERIQARGPPGSPAADPRLRAYRGLTGQRVFGLFAPIRGSSWAVVTEIPVSEAFADFRLMWLFLVLFGALGAGLASFFGAAKASVLARPVNALAEAARRLGEGELGDVSLALGRDDELGILARAFDSMQGNLRARSADLSRRVEELTLTKAELLASERKFRAVFDQTFQLMCLIDGEGGYLEANRTALDLLPDGARDFGGTPFWEMPWWTPVPGEPERIRAATLRAAGGGFERFEAVHADSAGRFRTVDLSLKPVRGESGEVVLIIAEGRDISERIQVEANLKAHLREKEVLLKEVHHRVKNNLQVIVSLLNLQSSRIDEPEVGQLYEESVGRIRTMAQVHELLYESPSLANIDLAEQIRLIVDDLYDSYRHGFGEVRLQVETEPVLLGIDQAVPCGLIVNEALTNSFKHAFPASTRRSGLISIRLAKGEGGEVELILADDGVGIPRGIGLEGQEWVGLSLITLLVEQLGGSVELERDRGTSYRIRFRVAVQSDAPAAPRAAP